MPIVLIPHRCPRFFLVPALLALLGCEPEPGEDGPPPLPPEVVTDVAEPAGTDWTEAYPITTSDIGELVIASGIVVGSPGPEGFFLRTEGGQVVLVRSPQPAREGQAVRATGPVREADAQAFRQWERAMLDAAEVGGEVVRPFYIEARRVVSAVGL